MSIDKLLKVIFYVMLYDNILIAVVNKNIPAFVALQIYCKMI